MKPPEFDKFASGYKTTLADSIILSGEEPEYFAEYKVQDVANYVLRRGLTVRSVLDFGCGTGGSAPYFRKHFPASKLTGVDVSQRSLEVARAGAHGEVEYCLFDGELLPFESNTFDIAFAA